MSTYSGSYFKDEMLGHPNNLDVDHLEQTGSNSTGNLKHSYYFSGYYTIFLVWVLFHCHKTPTHFQNRFNL